MISTLVGANLKSWHLETPTDMSNDDPSEDPSRNLENRSFVTEPNNINQTGMEDQSQIGNQVLSTRQTSELLYFKNCIKCIGTVLSHILSLVR